MKRLIAKLQILSLSCACDITAIFGENIEATRIENILYIYEVDDNV